MKRSVALSIAAVTMFSISASAATERASFRLAGTVHTICRVSFSGTGQASQNSIDLGNVEQLCNSRNGYRVVMQHPANLGQAVLVIGTRRIPLSPGNETVIINENHPVFASQTAQLEIASTQSVPALSFRIEPKGAIF